MLNRAIKAVFRAFGLMVQRYNPNTSEQALIKYLIDRYKIDLIVDVGANIGQFANALRNMRYVNQIVSFEPISQCFDELCFSMKNDSNFEAQQLAIGDYDGQSTINVSKNLVSSSLLKVNDEVASFADQLSSEKTEVVEVRKLDTVFKGLQTENVYLKIDVQGFEKEVIEGGTNFLKQVKIVQVETALTSLYKNGSRLKDILELLIDCDFLPYNFTKGAADTEIGRLYELDMFFVKKGDE
jgi:FkbM family methyltransferase